MSKTKPVARKLDGTAMALYIGGGMLILGGLGQIALAAITAWEWTH